MGVDPILRELDRATAIMHQDRSIASYYIERVHIRDREIEYSRNPAVRPEIGNVSILIKGRCSETHPMGQLSCVNP